MADKNKASTKPAAGDDIEEPKADPNWTPLEKYLDELAQKQAQAMVDREMIDLGALPMDEAEANADWIKTVAKQRRQEQEQD